MRLYDPTLANEVANKARDESIITQITVLAEEAYEATIAEMRDARDFNVEVWSDVANDKNNEITFDGCMAETISALGDWKNDPSESPSLHAALASLQLAILIAKQESANHNGVHPVGQT